MLHVIKNKISYSFDHINAIAVSIIIYNTVLYISKHPARVQVKSAL